MINCKECGEELEKTTYNRLFCSKKCLAKHHNKRRDRNKYITGNEICEIDFQIVEEMFGKIILCPKCRRPLIEYWKLGKKKNKRKENKDRFRCLGCGHHFTPHSVGFRMQHAESTILEFIELRKDGLSVVEAQEKLKIKIGMMTAYRWNKKFVQGEEK